MGVREVHGEAEAEKIEANTDAFVIGASRNDNKVHIPAPESTKEDPEPLCPTVSQGETGWRQKALDTRPEPWRTWCSRCGTIYLYDRDSVGGPKESYNGRP